MMEKGKVYYVLMFKDRFFDDIVQVYGDKGEPVNSTIMTTKNIEDTTLFDNYEEAQEKADKYGFDVASVTLNVKILKNTNNQTLSYGTIDKELKNIFKKIAITKRDKGNKILYKVEQGNEAYLASILRDSFNYTVGTGSSGFLHISW